MDDGIELADLIWQLRSELTRAMLTGKNKELRFRAETVDLELAVAVEKVKDPNIKVRFWVLDAGAGAKRTTTVTQTVRLSLRPVTAADPRQAALISGDSLPDER